MLELVREALREAALGGAERVGVPLGALAVVHRHEGRLAAHGQAHVREREARHLDEAVEEGEPVMGAEDFAFMLESKPGAFIFIGNGDTAGLHHPAYNFDDSAIPFGSSWYAEMAETRMPAA